MSDDTWTPPIFHHGSKGDVVRLDELHSARLYNIAAKHEREGTADERTITHIRTLADAKVDQWVKDQPEAYAEWATKNPDAHAKHEERRSKGVQS